MPRFHCCLAAAAGALALAAVPAGAVAPAFASSPSTVVVPAGQSVQSAIDRVAADGTVIVSGRHAENLLITKPLTLLGRNGAVLTPASSVRPNFCTEDPDATPPPGRPNDVGVCILGRLGSPPSGGDEPPVIAPVHNVTVSDLTISGFSGQGVLAYGTAGLRLVSDHVLHTADVGVFVENADNTVASDDEVTGSGSAGVRFADSHGVTVNDTRFSRDREGMLVIDTLQGNLTHDEFVDNCAGLLAIDDADGTATGRLTVTDSNLSGNNRFCPATDAPSESGTGIGLIGTTGMVFEHDLIAANRPSAPSDSPGGGVVLLDGRTMTGGAAPTDNRFVDNVIVGNSPRDITIDGSGEGNVFRGNVCGTSTQPGICRGG